jgi:hypothetical protein
VIALPSALYGSQVLSCSGSFCGKFDVVARRYFKQAIRCSVSTPSVVLFFEFRLFYFRHYFARARLLFLWRIIHLPSSHLLSSFPVKESRFWSECLDLLAHYQIDAAIVVSAKKVEWSRLVAERISLSMRSECEAWSRSSSLMSSCYNLLKASPVPDSYLQSPDGYVSRLIFKLRSGVNCLMGHLMRYDDGVSRRERLCPLCDAPFEDTFHFLAECSALGDLRSVFSVGLAELVAKVPAEFRVLAGSVFAHLSPLDFTRFLLGSYEILSCVIFRTCDWLPTILCDVEQLAFRVIRSLYSRRIELVHN